jgi:hypothetical protein
LGRPHHPQSPRPSGAGGRRRRGGTRAGSRGAAGGAREARASRPRRQGACGLERAHDLGARLRRASVRQTRLARRSPSRPSPSSSAR